MNTSYLAELESASIRIIREAYYEYREQVAILWSMGKDSTTLVHLARKAFLGRLPVSVIHLDTTFKFKEIYEFRTILVKKWGLNLIVGKNNAALDQGTYPGPDKFLCCNALKTETLKQVIGKYGLKALLVAIRRDEHAIRAKERYFSMRDREFKWDYRNQPLELWSDYYKTQGNAGGHFRIHPLLHWREIDIWRYIQKERLPVVRLYFARNNKRFRSIGCECCCLPIESSADTIGKIISELERTSIPERAGRAQDKEKEFMMQKLRSLGYM